MFGISLIELFIIVILAIIIIKPKEYPYVISKIRNLYQQLRKSYSLAITEINQMKNQIVTLDETNKLKSDIENLDHDIKKVIGDDGKLYDAYDINDLLDKNEKN